MAICLLFFIFEICAALLCLAQSRIVNKLSHGTTLEFPSTKDTHCQVLGLTERWENNMNIRIEMTVQMILEADIFLRFHFFFQSNLLLQSLKQLPEDLRVQEILTLEGKECQ